MKIALPTDRPTPAPTAPAPHPIRHVPPAATREIGKISPAGISRFHKYVLSLLRSIQHDAEIAQLVEHQLPKLRVAGSNPVFRSRGPKQRGPKENRKPCISMICKAFSVTFHHLYRHKKRHAFGAFIVTWLAPTEPFSHIAHCQHLNIGQRSYRATLRSMLPPPRPAKPPSIRSAKSSRVADSPSLLLARSTKDASTLRPQRCAGMN